MDLQVPIEQVRSGTTLSLSYCLKQFIAKEQLRMPCVKCSRNGEVRKLRDMSLWKLPKVLVVHLKRFLVQGWDKQKIESKVRIPFTLKMSDFAPHSGKFWLTLDDKSTLQPNYKLYGICHHVGNLKFGHYTA
jgi:ubiquitin carboxyl-terminal hydrolase 8